jgi:hypothetical protein
MYVYIYRHTCGSHQSHQLCERWLAKAPVTVVIGTINQFVKLELCEPQLVAITRGLKGTPRIVGTLGLNQKQGHCMGFHGIMGPPTMKVVVP